MASDIVRVCIQGQANERRKVMFAVPRLFETPGLQASRPAFASLVIGMLLIATIGESSG